MAIVNNPNSVSLFGSADPFMNMLTNAMQQNNQPPAASAQTTNINTNPTVANLLALQEQMKQKNADIQAKLAAYNEAALKTPSLRFMKEDQGFLDAIKDPTQAQRNAIIQFGLGLAGSNSTNSLSQRIGQALGVGMQALQTGRQAELQREAAKAKTDLTTAQAQVQNLQTEFGNQARIATLLKPTTEPTATQLMAKRNFDKYSGAMDAASNAISMNQELDFMNTALDSGDLKTGIGSKFVSRIGSFASYLGVPEDSLKGLTQTEMYEALSNRLALQVRNPESGLGLPGNTSNRDLNFLKDSVPGLAKSVAGNKLLIQVMKAKNQFQIDYGNEVDRIVQQNGGVVPSNLDTLMLDFANNYQILTPDLRQAITNETNKTVDPNNLDPLPKDVTSSGNTIKIY